MTKKQVQLFFFVIGLAVISSCTSFQDTVWTDSEIIDAEYEVFAQRAEAYLAEKKFQGAVLVGKNRRILFAKGFGLCDPKNPASEPVSINTTFEAGSISKQMTAAAIMQLARKNRLSVDDRLSKYFPDYGHGEDITVRMLLTMRSGLTDHINCPEEFFVPATYRQVLKAESDGTPLDRDLVLQQLYTAPLLAPPDSTYFYCNTDYYLLARIIEMASGQDYESYIKKHIFEKCGMFSTNNAFQQTQARGYDYKGRYLSIPAALALGCGDVNSTVTDLFKWNVCFTSGKVTGKKAFREMTSFDSYGYGVYCAGDSIFHGGTTDVFNAYDAYFFDDKVSVIVLVNKPIYELNATVIAGNLRKIFLECEAK